MARCLTQNPRVRFEEKFVNRLDALASVLVLLAVPAFGEGNKG
jgi:hypothetical protein